jgi:hypothetical protein
MPLDDEYGYAEEPVDGEDQTPAVNQLLELKIPVQLQDWGRIALPDDISDFVTKVGKDPVGFGGFGEVYKGIWNDSSAAYSLVKVFNSFVHLKDKEVAIKVIRPVVEGPERDAVKRVGLLWI